MIIFGFIGYLMRKFDFEGSPFLLALVWGPMVESKRRESLLISRGTISIFFSRPISAVFLFMTLVMLLTSFYRYLKRKS